MAWNPAVEPFMFATGSHDGAVRIWTTPKNKDNVNGNAAISDDSIPASQATTNGRNTPRTISPSPYDIQYTDSPSTSQAAFDLTQAVVGGQLPPRSSEDSSSSRMVDQPRFEASN